MQTAEQTMALMSQCLISSYTFIVKNNYVHKLRSEKSAE